jgi:hypothetical protein
MWFWYLGSVNALDVGMRTKLQTETGNNDYGDYARYFLRGTYINASEYKDAPTSIDYDNLVVGGNASAQDAELSRVILRASSYMNEYLNQSLLAESIYRNSAISHHTSRLFVYSPFRRNHVVARSLFLWAISQ